jgi:hypothetical protein
MSKPLQIRRGRHEHPFLPTTMAEVQARGWKQLDIVMISGDAYVDHPAFGPPLIARFLEGRGFKVGIIAQPDWQSAEPFRALGKPRLFFGVSAGNMDSMLNRLTAQKKNRHDDAIFARRRPRQAARPRDHRLRQSRARGVPRRADRARRHRGVAAPHRPLRLLVGQGAPLDLARRKGGPPASSAWASAPSGRSRAASTPARRSSSSATCAARPTDERKSTPTISKLLAEGAEPPSPTGAMRSAVVREVEQDKKKFARASRTLHRDQPAQRAGARPAPRRPRSLLQPAGASARPRRDGRALRPALRRAPHPIYGDAPSPRVRDGEEVRGDHHARLLRRLHVLLDHRARGARHPEPLGRLRSCASCAAIRDKTAGSRGVLSDLGGPTANMYRMKCKDEKFESRAAASPACIPASART